MARKDRGQRQKFLRLARGAFSLDAFARIDYYGSAADIEGPWAEYLGDRLQHMAEEETYSHGMETVPVFVDHERERIMPLKFHQAAGLAGKGHLSVCLVPGKCFEAAGYDSFMSMLADHEHGGHAVVFRDGLRYDDGAGERLIDFKELHRLSGMPDSHALGFIHTITELVAYKHQLENGAFSRALKPEDRARLEPSFFEYYRRLWDFPETGFRDSMIAAYFHMPWLYSIASPAMLWGRHVLLASRQGKTYEFPVPAKLAQRLAQHF